MNLATFATETTRLSVRQQILADQARRRTVQFAVPAWWTTADMADIRRELVGIIWQACPELDGVAVEVRGVRDDLRYRAPSAPEWTPVEKSRLIRDAGRALTVVFAVAK